MRQPVEIIGSEGELTRDTAKQESAMYMDDYDEDYGDSGWGRFWKNLPPGLKSAALLWIVSLGFGVLHGVTAGISLLLCYPVKVLFYVVNGVLAGYFAINQGHDPGDLARIGAMAGFYLWILPALVYLVFGFLLGISTFGLGFIGVATWLICGPVELAVQMGAGAFGGWFYGRVANVDEEENY